VRLTRVNLNRHLKQSGFHHFHPSSSLRIPFRALGLLLLLPGLSVIVQLAGQHRTLQPLYTHLPRQKAAVRLSPDKLQCLVSGTCHSHINNHLHFETYSISGKQDLQQ